MLFAAELYTPSGHPKDVYTERGDEPLTPTEVLNRCLNTHLPEIFEVEVTRGTGTHAYVGLVLPLLSTAGLQAGVGMVWHAENFTGALELWRPDASGGLRLSNGFYGAQRLHPPTFASVSQKTTFNVLEGLPGVTFDAHEPVIFETLSEQRGFVRFQAAASAGFHAGLGIPVLENKTATCAALLLSGTTPLVRAFEVWRGGGRTVQLRARRVLIEPGSTSPGIPSKVAAEVATAVVKTRFPQLRRYGERTRLGLPIFDGKGVGSVVVLEV